jgi:flagellar basal body-associated protein FliL
MDDIWIASIVIICLVIVMTLVIQFIIIPNTDKWNSYYHNTNNQISNMTCKDLGNYLVINVNNRTNQLQVNLYDYAKVRFDTGGCIVK